MLSKRKVIFIHLVMTVLIVLTSSISVFYAFFFAKRQSESSLTFKSGITLTVGGVTQSGNNYYWNYRNRPSTSSDQTYKDGVAAPAIVDYLELAPITVTVTAGATCYLRMFACVSTNIEKTKYTLASFPSSLTGTGAATRVDAIYYQNSNKTTSTNFITAENNFDFPSSLSPQQTVKWVSTCTVSANNSTFTMISLYTPINLRGSTEYANANFLNKKIYLYLSVSASVDNTSWTTFTLTAPS